MSCQSFSSFLLSSKKSTLHYLIVGGGVVAVLAFWPKNILKSCSLTSPPSFSPTLSILTTIFNNTFYYPSPLFKNLRGAQAAIWNFLYTITKWSCLLVGYTFSCFILSVIVLMFELIVFWSACKNHKSMKYKIKKTWK